VAGALVQRDIPAVVAMQFEISDEAAIVFAGGFYEPLAGGVPVDASLAAARLAMLAERSDDIEWGTPVLFMRVPDGRIFDLGEDGRAPSAGAAVTRSAQIVAHRPTDKTARGLRIFLNYRHQDTSGHALLLTDRLVQHFGEGNVQGAVDHGTESERREEIRAHGALLALIGPGWVSSLRTGGTRSHADDAPRRELEWALRDAPDRVIPVLIDTAMPHPETLPRSLRAICRKEPAELRHASFDSDVAGLCTRIEHLAASRAPQAGEDGRQDGHASRARDLTPRPAATRAAAGISEPYHDHYVDVINGMLATLVGPSLSDRASFIAPARSAVPAG
jgi:hypothetical protein